MHDKDRYIALLRSLKWRRKRQSVMDRDGNKCTVCGNTENLVVHHTFYYTDLPDPWKYPNASLLTLCEECHKDFHRHHETPIRSRKDVKMSGVVVTNKRIKNKKGSKGVRSIAEQQEVRGVKSIGWVRQ
jgi:5-methylcytosine-specific restriction endonuclease McrA